MNPFSQEFIEKYPFQIQQYKPYRTWSELDGHNFATSDEAMTVMKYLIEKHGKKKLRVIDRRSGIVQPRIW